MGRAGNDTEASNWGGFVCFVASLIVSSAVMSLFVQWFGKPDELELTIVGLPTLIGSYLACLWVWLQWRRRQGLG